MWKEAPESSNQEEEGIPARAEAADWEAEASERSTDAIEWDI